MQRYFQKHAAVGAVVADPDQFAAQLLELFDRAGFGVIGGAAFGQ